MAAPRTMAAPPGHVVVLQGGLNNMLMHVAQRLHEGCFDPKVYRLNSGHMFVADASRKRSHRLDEIFELADLFVASNRSCVTPFLTINRRWWTRRAHVEQLRRVYARLRLSDRLRRHVVHYATVVHVRMERDWVDRAQMCRRRGHCVDVDEIAAQVRDPAAAVAISTANTAPRALSRLARRWRTILPTLPHLSYTENAAVQMMTAVEADVFWGNAFSTFSIGVSQVRAARHRKPSFAYNCADASGADASGAGAFRCATPTTRHMKTQPF